MLCMYVPNWMSRYWVEGKGGLRGLIVKRNKIKYFQTGWEKGGGKGDGGAFVVVVMASAL